MARLCERPGCSQPAEVMYGIDAEHLVVWIEPLDGAQSYRAGVLCRRHADAMVVPLGWMLDDRREPVPRLFKTRESSPAATPKPRRQRSHAARDETGQLSLTDPERVVAAAVAELAAISEVAASDPVVEHLAPDESPAPWKPVFDQRDDLDGLLTARSPLLSRAFGKRDQPPT